MEKGKNFLVDSNCLFCRFVDQHNEKLYEDNHVYMIKDISPKAEHHFLVIPKRHIRDSSHIRNFDDMDDVEHMISVAYNYI